MLHQRKWTHTRCKLKLWLKSLTINMHPLKWTPHKKPKQKMVYTGNQGGILTSWIICVYNQCNISLLVNTLTLGQSRLIHKWSLTDTHAHSQTWLMAYFPNWVLMHLLCTSFIQCVFCCLGEAGCCSGGGSLSASFEATDLDSQLNDLRVKLY